MEPIKRNCYKLRDALKAILVYCDDTGQRNALSIYIAPDTGYVRAAVVDPEKQAVVYELYTLDGRRWFESEEVI